MWSGVDDRVVLRFQTFSPPDSLADVRLDSWKALFRDRQQLIWHSVEG